MGLSSRIAPQCLNNKVNFLVMFDFQNSTFSLSVSQIILGFKLDKLSHQNYSIYITTTLEMTQLLRQLLPSQQLSLASVQFSSTYLTLNMGFLALDFITRLVALCLKNTISKIHIKMSFTSQVTKLISKQCQQSLFC